MNLLVMGWMNGFKSVVGYYSQYYTQNSFIAKPFSNPVGTGGGHPSEEWSGLLSSLYYWKWVCLKMCLHTGIILYIFLRNSFLDLPRYAKNASSAKALAHGNIPKMRDCYNEKQWWDMHTNIHRILTQCLFYLWPHAVLQDHNINFLPLHTLLWTNINKYPYLFD